MPAAALVPAVLALTPAVSVGGALLPPPPRATAPAVLAACPPVLVVGVLLVTGGCPVAVESLPFVALVPLLQPAMTATHTAKTNGSRAVFARNIKTLHVQSGTHVRWAVRFFG
jgi:hypothetical protein